MDRYKVLYVDEEQIWRDHFTRYAHNEFDLEVIEPMETKEELIDYILSSSANAVVLDHFLAEKSSIDIAYDGVDVAEGIKNINSNFPIFVLTSYDTDAMEEAKDVNYIYSKNAISSNNKSDDQKVESREKFNDRIRLQIKHYFEAIEAAEKTFHALIKKAETEALNAEQEEQLIELDTFLNEQIGRDLDIPKHLKTKAKADQTQELIEVTKELMEKISQRQGT